MLPIHPNAIKYPKILWEIDLVGVDF